MEDKNVESIQHTFMKKVLDILEIQVTYLNIIKEIYSKHIANIKLNGENLKAIPPKSGTRQDCLLYPYLFNRVLDVFARTIRQLEEIKGLQMRKKKNQSIIIYRSCDSKHK